MISVIIVSFNTAALLRACVASALEALGDEAEIIVVDNASSDDSVEMVRGAFPSVRLLALTDNLGFGAANNVGVAAASAPYVMLLNSDTILQRADWRAMLRYLDAHPDVDCVGPRIVLPDGQDQPRALAPSRRFHASRCRAFRSARRSGASGRSKAWTDAPAAATRIASAGSRACAWSCAERTSSPAAASTRRSSCIARTSTSAGACRRGASRRSGSTASR